MAAPATFVTVRGGRITVAHHNVGAYEILEHSVFGPEVTARYLDAWQEFEPSDEWTNDVSAEGGLLVDFDRRVLVMFSVYREPALRAAYLEAVTRTWPGWQVRWAYDGIADLVAHVGGDVSRVRRAPSEPEVLYRGERTEDMRLRFVVTIGDTQAYGLAWNAVEPWLVGAGLPEQLHPGDRITAAATVPEAGMHLDPVTRTAGVWSTVRPLRGLAEYWPVLWPGWTLELWDDRCSEQLKRSAGAVTFPLADPDGPRHLAESVMRTWSMFVVEDIDGNIREAFDSDETRSWARHSGWFRPLEQTRITRAELSTVLESITGRQWTNPRWPAFDEPQQ